MSSIRFYTCFEKLHGWACDSIKSRACLEVEASLVGMPLGGLDMQSPLQFEPQGSCQSDVPSRFLQNITGFMVGKAVSSSVQIPHELHMFEDLSLFEMFYVTSR